MSGLDCNVFCCLIKLKFNFLNKLQFALQELLQSLELLSVILCGFFDRSESVVGVCFLSWSEECKETLKLQSSVRRPHTDSLMPSLKVVLPLKISSYKVDAHVFVSLSTSSSDSLCRSRGSMTGGQDPWRFHSRQGSRDSSLTGRPFSLWVKVKVQQTKSTVVELRQTCSA